MVRVALTGSPGVGKSTLAAVAAQHGWRVVDVRAWARERGCASAPDESGVEDIDVVRLARHVPAEDGRKVLFEGHVSHFLPLDAAWIVRCDPRVLRPRLEKRGYASGKVAANLEAEAMDLILQECAGRFKRIVQRDGTRRSPEALYKSFADVRLESLKAPDLEPVDWSDQLPIQV